MSLERVPSGNREVDWLLGGGFPARSIHMLMGPPGSGKTILAEQIAYTKASDPRPVLYVTTVSEPMSKFIAFLQQRRSVDMRMIGTEVVYEDVGESLGVDPSGLPDRLLELIKEHRPRIIIIDSIKAVADLMPDIQTWRRTLHRLAGVLSAYNATSFWIGEYTPDMVPHMPEFAVADGIVELAREQRGSSDERFLRVVKLRGSDFHGGHHTFTISDHGIQVFPRFVTPSVTPDYAPTTERLQSGIDGLDDMVASGWLRGTTALVIGPSGAGKTMLGLHFLREGARRGEPSLLVNFQENPTQIARMTNALGWGGEELFGPNKLDVLYRSPVELQIDTIIREMFERVAQNGVKRVVIDAVADLAGNARDPVRIRDYLYTLTQRFASGNVTCMMTMESNADHDGAAIGKELSYMSDNTVLLGMEMAGELRRTIRIVKSRGSAHDGRKRALRIGQLGMAVEAIVPST